MDTIASWLASITWPLFSRVLAALGVGIVQRLVLHRPVILAGAKGRPQLDKPFPRRPDGIAARRTFAFQHPRRLLLRGGRLGRCIEAGMGQGACGL